MSDKKEKDGEKKEQSGVKTIPVPDTRYRRIIMLNAEIASLNARLHEHLAIICEDNEVDASAGAMFAPDFKAVIITSNDVPAETPPAPKLEPE